MPSRVVVVGSVNVDLVVRAPHLPRPGETVTGGTFARYHGGKGGNQAVASARLEVATVLVGAVGNDDLGGEARAALEADGVLTESLATLPDVPTGVALIVVDADGENLIAVASGANARVTPDLVGDALDGLGLGPGDIVLVGHEIPTDAVRVALVAGRTAGAVTILNPAPATGIDRSCLAHVDVLTPNRVELHELVSDEVRRTGRSSRGTDAPLAAAGALLEPSPEGAGPLAVLVSLGPAGAVLVRSDRPPLELAAPRVEAVDTTGAGDALNGALAASLAAGHDLAEASRRAVVAATRSTLAAGARGGLVTRAELDSLGREGG